MASASIESSVTAPVVKGLVTGASRDDLEVNDVVLLNSANAGTAYSWSLAYVPPGSAATFSGSSTAQSPGSFTVDVDGPYLIRLQFTDGTGITEQFVRLRALTAFASLHLVAAGERVDSVSVPVDITPDGWADEQNTNLTTLLGLVETASSSGRVRYVDPLQGDYNTIQAAMAYAQTQTPTAVAPWVILVRPGTYVEDLTFYPYVHVFGWPGGEDTRVVRIQNSLASHTAVLAGGGDNLRLSNLYFEWPAITVSPVFSVSGAGTFEAYRCRFHADGAGIPQGAALATSGTCSVSLEDCRVTANPASSSGSYSFLLGSGTSARLWNSRVEERGIQTEVGTSLKIRDCRIDADSDYQILSLSNRLELDYTTFEGSPVLQDLGLNPTGGAVVGNLRAWIRWTKFSTLTFDTAGVTGATSLSMGSCEHGALTFPSGSPATLVASTLSSTLFYDNAASGLASGNVQDALDELSTGLGFVTQDVFIASAFAFGGGVSVVALSHPPDLSALHDGVRVLYRNGIADMENVTPAVPVTATEFRIAGGNLEIGADVTATGDTYRFVYPSL
jgi:hypothetical protein